MSRSENASPATGATETVVSTQPGWPAKWNPLFHLGSLSFYLFWLVAITGLYLFVFFETSIDGAYHSIEAITNEQFIFGGLVRSIHRYASSLMAITVTAHLIRELLLGRFRGARWFSWVTGVPLLWLLFASAIGGYWLVWDEKAEYIAISTATLFDALPIVVEPMAFGFIDDATVSDRFFSLLIFLHVGVPLGLLLGMFIHIKRINHPRISPSRRAAVGVLTGLLVLSLFVPARSMGPANLDTPLRNVEMDWFYMNIYPMVDLIGPGATWALLLLLTGGLFALPWLDLLKVRSSKESGGKGRSPVQLPAIAVVDPEFCNGCSWCFADCPFEAIYMKPHETRPGHRQAVVIADQCVGCGICAGACPSATPFKHFNEAKSGIDLSNMKNSDLLADVRERLQKIPDAQKVLVVGCAHGVDVRKLESASVATLELECIGQLPPSYMDFLVRRQDVGAVLLTGCESDNCYHRLGIDLQEERLHRLREPHLRFADVKERIDKLWIGRGGEDEVQRRIEEIRESFKTEETSIIKLVSE